MSGEVSQERFGARDSREMTARQQYFISRKYLKVVDSHQLGLGLFYVSLTATEA
jgi:hypothetical protein